MPGYFQEARGLDLSAVGRLLWIPFLSAGVGALGGAWASSALIQRGFSLDRGRKAVLYASAFLSAVGASACFAADHRSAIALVSVIIGLSASFFFSLPSGAAIVLCLLLFFIAALVINLP